jgi:hypothetical protein
MSHTRGVTFYVYIFHKVDGLNRSIYVVQTKITAGLSYTILWYIIYTYYNIRDATARPEMHEWRSLLPLKGRAPAVTEMTTGYCNVCLSGPHHMFFPVHCGCWFRTSAEPLSMTIWYPLHTHTHTHTITLQYDRRLFKQSIRYQE